MKIAVVSGGFDPLHSGHINLLEQAATFGDKLAHTTLQWRLSSQHFLDSRGVGQTMYTPSGTLVPIDPQVCITW